jgi:hypothetical protein
MLFTMGGFADDGAFTAADYQNGACGDCTGRRALTERQRVAGGSQPTTGYHENPKAHIGFSW